MALPSNQQINVRVKVTMSGSKSKSNSMLSYVTHIYIHIYIYIYIIICKVMYTHMAVVNKTLTKTYYINYEPPRTFPPIHDIDIFLRDLPPLS